MDGLEKSAFFVVGQRVRLSNRGIHAGLQGRAPTALGTVTKLNRVMPEYVWVRRDGIIAADRYAAVFWEAV